MKNYKQLVEYYKDTPVNSVIEDLYLDLLHRTEAINKLSRKIQKLRKQLKKEQELKMFQYEMKVQSYEELIKLQERIDKAIKYIHKNTSYISIECMEQGLLQRDLDKVIEILGGKEC